MKNIFQVFFMFQPNAGKYDHFPKKMIFWKRHIFSRNERSLSSNDSYFNFLIKGMKSSLKQMSQTEQLKAPPSAPTRTTFQHRISIIVP